MPNKRKILIAGNWKMNLIQKEAIALAIKIKNSLLSLSTTEIVLCPPFLYIPEIKEIFTNTVVKIGAQNVYFEESGAFTGEIAPEMLKNFCEYVIIGHSERRQILKESDEDVNKKVLAVLKNGMNPIICVGETLEAWRKGDIDTVLDQVKEALKGIKPEEIDRVVIAYEPIWAIGSSNPATSSYANRICMQIRQLAGSLFTREAGGKIRILYGGSVNKDNANQFVAESEIDGLLVGGASLKADEFIDIVRKSSKVK